MLTALRVRQVAVIEALELTLGPGLTVLTGETGAGKSIIVDTLTLLLGARASADLIRAGAEEATVEAHFDVSGDEALAARLEEMGVEGARDGELLVKRVISRAGRARAYLNGGPATAGMLAAVGERLVAIAGQHESQRLLRPDTHLDLLDAYGRLGEARRAYAAKYEAWRETAERLAALRAAEGRRGERVELIRHDLDELTRAALDPEEETRLLEERKLLASAEKRRHAAETAHDRLYDAEDSATARLGAALEAARELARLDPSQRRAAEDLEAALAQAQELARAFHAYAAEVDAEGGRLDEVEARLALIARLKRKHGAATAAELAALAARLAEELATLESLEARIGEAEKATACLEREARAAADRLGADRRAAAGKLASEAEATLAALGMRRVRFDVGFAEQPEPPPLGPRGTDRVEFLLAANPGEPPRPLARVASGGELSRVTLALKGLLFEAGEATAYVFDEVDAGVGGAVAEVVGRELKRLASRAQVLCITHLPQIAAFADRHLRVVKAVDAGRAATRVEALDEPGRVEELSRMLAGRVITDAARQHAAALISLARNGDGQEPRAGRPRRARL
jgi:DNA repair protein RecN (Recombination protein N)